MAGNKKGGNFLAATVGTIVGVAAGVAATLLSDKKNRQVLEKKAGELVREGKVLANRATREVKKLTKTKKRRK